MFCSKNFFPNFLVFLWEDSGYNVPCVQTVPIPTSEGVFLARPVTLATLLPSLLLQAHFEGELMELWKDTAHFTHEGIRSSVKRQAHSILARRDTAENSLHLFKAGL